MLVNGYLFGKEATDEPAKQLFPVGGHRFMTVIRDGQRLGAEFGMDEKGTAKEVTLSNIELGRKLTIPKIN